MTTTPKPSADTVKCGYANPNGNVTFTFKGGCGKPVSLKDCYRCTGCGGRFHRNCIFDHFEKEKGHSRAHHALKKIKEYVMLPYSGQSFSDIGAMCDEGLDITPQKITLIPNP